MWMASCFATFHHVVLEPVHSVMLIYMVVCFNFTMWTGGCARSGCEYLEMNSLRWLCLWFQVLVKRILSEALKRFINCVMKRL